MSTMSTDYGWSADDVQTVHQFQHKLAALRRSIGAMPSITVPAAELENHFLRQWNDHLSRAQAVSFALWDTTLIRCCLQAEDRFLHLKTLAPFSEYALSRETIQTLRMEAEELARESKRQQVGSMDVTLEEIYRRFALDAHLPEEAVAACVQAEHTLERLLAQPNQRIAELVQAARHEGKKILIVTDSLMSSDSLLVLLRQNGFTIEPDNLFTATEHHTNYTSGMLLRKAVKSLSLEPEQLLHIANDPEIDATAARLAEVPCLLHPYGPDRTQSLEHLAQDVRHTESLLRGTSRSISFPPSLPPDDQSFWLQTGAQRLGPMLACFTLWLASRWQRDHIERAFFLGRSGQLLLQLYRTLQQYHPSLPPAEHLHASRRAYLLPTLGCRDSVNLTDLFAGYGSATLTELFDQLEIAPSRYSTAFNKAGFHSLELPIDPDHNRIRLQRLLRDPDLLGAIDQHAQCEREVLLRYLQQQHLTTDRSTALVDLGWSNTAIRSLLAILEHEEIHHNLVSYHLLTTAKAQSSRLENYHYHSYLAHNGEPLALSAPMVNSRALLHTLIAADQLPLQRFTLINNGITPIFDDLLIDPEQTAQLHALHQGILTYAQTIFQNPLRLNLLDTPPEIASTEYIRLCCQPTPEEALKLGALRYLNGSPHPRALARFTADTTAPKELLNDYQRADWKAGLLYQDSERAWLLRQLIAA